MDLVRSDWMHEVRLSLLIGAPLINVTCYVETIEIFSGLKCMLDVISDYKMH
jgi:hypothetical protein